MSKKPVNLQPWLDYFDMLHEYEQRGLFEHVPERDEVYILQSSLHAISEGDDPAEQMKKAIPDTIRRLRAYIRWKNQEGPESLSTPFVVNVVKDNTAHDVLYTVLLTTRRPWWKLWMRDDHFEVVTY